MPVLQAVLRAVQARTPRLMLLHSALPWTAAHPANLVHLQRQVLQVRAVLGVLRGNTRLLQAQQRVKPARLAFLDRW